MREVSSRICFAQPSTTGVPNRPMAMVNASTAPDRIAGAISGKVMRAAVRMPSSPLTRAASSRLGSMLRSAPATIIITYGAR